MMPKSQEHEIAGLIDKEWNNLSLEEKLRYEEEAEED
jgi:hypothetical protein